MIKTDLPVIVLKGIVLLPSNDVRLEFDEVISNNIIDIAELFHDNHILIVSQPDPLEETIDYEKLPKIGVIGKISNKLELPNGKTRVIITGIKRARIFEYLNTNKEDSILEAILEEVEPKKIGVTEENALIKKLYRELENYISIVPYSSNSVINMIHDINNLDKMTDIVVDYLPVNNERLMRYLVEINSQKRMEMILEDLYLEEDRFRIEREIDSKVQKTIEENQREFLLKEKLKEIKSELGEISLKEEEILEFSEKIENSRVPSKIKNRLKKELKQYELLPSTSPESPILRGYLEWMINLPWKKYTKDNHDLKKAKVILEDSHSGLKDVKLRILEFLAAMQMRGNLNGPIICLVGPPGVGKTSLAITIAKAMNRKFVKMSVGGIRDEAEILGHRRTYIGASPGRIIQGMRKAKTSNPVFLIDEIDKMGHDFKGNPADALLSILDPEQNKYFSDNYIEEEYDLSKVMFIATANNVEDIPRALRDRLEIIYVSEYTEYEKIEILKEHLLPKLLKEYGLEKYQIGFEPGVFSYIIQSYTLESGVRELERQLSKIIRKLIMEILLKSTKQKSYTITRSSVRNYLGKEKYFDVSLLKEGIGIVNALAYTNYGGDVLPIEITYFKGTGQLILTGSLGEVIQESARIAFSYIKANAKKFGIDEVKLVENDLHINIPEGSVPKDGPSAGVALVTAIVSAFIDKKVSNRIAMTGEISLRGNILPIGGVKEKSIGAGRRDIKTIYLPKANRKDLDEIPKEIRKNINFIFVDDYEEIYKDIFKR